MTVSMHIATCISTSALGFVSPNVFVSISFFAPIITFVVTLVLIVGHRVLFPFYLEHCIPHSNVEIGDTSVLLLINSDSPNRVRERKETENKERVFIIVYLTITFTIITLLFY